MSREIKFRAMVSCDIPHLGAKVGDWVYGWLVNDFIIQNGQPYNIKKETIGQLTGLCDKNGKEIYEKDVLSSPHFKDAAGRQHTLRHIVQWSDEYLGWRLQHPRAAHKNDGCLQMFVAVRNAEFEIIGNIFENPDLIESKQ